jgi:hypothetical protein
MIFMVVCNRQIGHFTDQNGSSSWSNTLCILKDGKLLNVQAQDYDARKKRRDTG